MFHEVGGGGKEVEVEVEGELGGVPVVPVPGVKNENYLPAWILDMRKVRVRVHHSYLMCLS
jgi:hypothetical protein